MAHNHTDHDAVTVPTKPIWGSDFLLNAIMFWWKQNYTTVLICICHTDRNSFVIQTSPIMDRTGLLGIVVQFLIKHILKWLYSHHFVVDDISYPLPSEPTIMTWPCLLSQASSQAAYLSSSIHYRSTCLCQRRVGRLVICWSLSRELHLQHAWYHSPSVWRMLNIFVQNYYPCPW